MKVLVLGGMHGNEPLGLEIVKLLRQKPLSSVDTLLANELAIASGVRFVKTDLNRSFPGSYASKNYEQRRAAEVLAACQGYDVVVDFHNTQCPGNDCSFVGSTASQLLYGVSNWFRLNRVIIADYDCLNKYAPNCISIEISTTSNRMQAQEWVTDIAALSKMSDLQEPNQLSRYRFVYRMTQEDRVKYKLDTLRLKAFQAIDPVLAKNLGVASPAYPIFIGDGYTPYNYGGLLNKINV